MKINSVTLFLFVFILITAFTGCKKDDTRPTPNFVLERIQYYPLEVAQIKSENINLTDTLYSGTINGQVVQLRNFGGQLVFFVPEIPAGNYEVKFLVNDAEYTLPLTVSALATVPNPDALLQTYIAQTDSAHAAITRLADSLQGSDKTAVLNDLQTITGIINNIYGQYNSLNAAEKQEFARTLAANQWWLDEVNTATKTLIQDVATYKNQAVVLNYEDRVTLTIFRFETALAVVLLHIPKVALWVGGGAAFGAIIIPIPGLGAGLGAALGAGVGIGFMLSDVQLLMASIDRMVNTAMLPTETWFCNKTNDFVGFTNMAAKTVTVNMTYRTVYNADANTSTSIAQRFIKGMAEFRNGLNTIAQYLPASLRQSKIIQSVTTYKTLPLAVNSQQLSVSDLSNNNVTLVNTDKTDGSLALTFKNSATTAQSFSFKLNYNNSDFGTYEKVVDASVSAEDTTPSCATTCPATVTDIDGNVYNVVKIGCQCWTKENLKTTSYADGSAIVEIQDSTAWANNWNTGSNTPAWCYYDKSSSNNANYGKLYNWYAVADPRNVCPAGWHVPSDNEWTILSDTLGGITVAGGKMKTTTLWKNPNTGATNSSGFSATPGGDRMYSAYFFDLGFRVFWWSSSEYSTDNAFLRFIEYDSQALWGFNGNSSKKNYGYSVRCVKD
jgi:uncharacterized protein (TIGR02145 family)